MNLNELFLDPLQFQFMERALIAAILVGGISGMVGAFVVLRGMSFFGDALAHSILPGVTIAYIYGRDLFIGGLIAGIGTAIGVGWLTREQKIKEDTAIGVMFAGMFALGIAIISTTRSYSTDLTHILFGNILGVTPNDLNVMVYCGIFILLMIAIFYKELVISSFDPVFARSVQLPNELLRLLLLVMVAVTIVASLRIVGTAMMLAMLVTPAATARLLVKRFYQMMFLSSLLGIIGGVVGLYISYHRDIATGPAIVLTITAIFFVVFILSQISAGVENFRSPNHQIQ